MKILDFDKKGNAIRFYLGKDNLKGWYGDDWDDRGCTDRVYDEFVSEVKDIVIPYKHSVYSPFDFYHNEDQFSKDMFKSGNIPMLVIVKDEDKDYKNYEYHSYDWNSALGDKDSIAIYMGEDIQKVEEKLKELE